MQYKQLILSIFSSIVLALAAITIWLTELLWQVGWSDPGWLWTSQYAIFGVNLFIVLAYLLPVRFLNGLHWRKLWMPGLELYFVTIIVFFITKSILYSLFLPISVFNLSSNFLWLMLGALVITSASSFYYLTRNYLYPVKVAFIPLMVGAELLVAMLSYLTAILIFGMDHFETALMASVKAGFPFFYATLLVGFFSVLSIKKLSLKKLREDQDEILDDVEFPA